MAAPKVTWRDGRLIHFSVGALIIKDGKVLLMDRKKPPFGMAGPAGHIDEGEEPLEALKREVREETGLGVTGCVLVREEFVPWNECSSGVKGHYWYLYECLAEGTLRRSVQEAKSLGWYEIAIISRWEPVWEHWMRELTLLKEE